MKPSHRDWAFLFASQTLNGTDVLVLVRQTKRFYSMTSCLKLTVHSSRLSAMDTFQSQVQLGFCSPAC
jgi:hypothetical protein